MLYNYYETKSLPERDRERLTKGKRKRKGIRENVIRDDYAIRKERRKEKKKHNKIYSHQEELKDRKVII